MEPEAMRAHLQALLDDESRLLASLENHHAPLQGHHASNARERALALQR